MVGSHSKLIFFKKKVYQKIFNTDLQYTHVIQTHITFTTHAHNNMYTHKVISKTLTHTHTHTHHKAHTQIALKLAVKLTTKYLELL